MLALLRLLPVLAGCVAMPSARAADGPPLVLERLAEGVYLHRAPVLEWAASGQDDVANLGVVVGERCVAVIDTGGSPSAGRRLRAAIARLTALPVCAVINTHAHPDHVFGNAAFAGSGPAGADPQYIAHARFSDVLAARERRYLGVLQRELDPGSGVQALVHPSLGVAGEHGLDLGGRTLHLQAWPTAHTQADLSVYDPATRTLFLGDLWFAGHLPVLDGSLRGWSAVSADLARIDAAQVVPGHGAPSADWPAVLQPQRDYLAQVQRHTRAALKAGRTLSQAVADGGTGGGIDTSAWQLVDLFHRRNLTAAYAELEWED